MGVQPADGQDIRITVFILDIMRSYTVVVPSASHPSQLHALLCQLGTVSQQRMASREKTQSRLHRPRQAAAFVKNQS
jgi:hypothetical protein